MIKRIINIILTKLSLRKHKLCRNDYFKENHKGVKTMPNDLEKKVEETKTTETPVEKVEETKVDETKAQEKEVPAEKEAEKVDEKVETEKENAEEEKQPEQAENQDEDKAVVDSVEEGTQPNAIRVEDLVTKADLQEMLNAFNAKLDAIIKENTDLKEANSKMHDKYEVGNFGTDSKKGIMGNGDTKTTSYQSFDEYAKQFM